MLSFDIQPFMKFSSALSLACLCVLTNACGYNVPGEVQLAYSELPKEVDFNFDVKPILSDKCYACHGPDEKKREADLRLDVAEEAYKDLGDDRIYQAIVPKNPAQSMLVQRIMSTDPDLIMPSPDSHLKLTLKEKAILIRWIEQGANYEKHWSFVIPNKEKVPRVKEANWIKNPVDNYVLEKLEHKGIKPSKEANKTSLIRRVSFDLCGLPPSLTEIDTYLADTLERAYENMVDKYLSSDSYGERMASDWMDVARYADSDGYLDDKHRDFSPWRDWVIEAFNDNMSYRQFVTWQLAGDLVENKSQESVLATAFNRLHRKNSEAGIIFEEYRSEYVADRTHTLGKAFLGLSVECARCHDHKYDPISQKDYYRMFGFFNSTNEWGSAVYGPDQTPGPSLLLSSPEKDSLISFIKNKISASEIKLSQIKGESFSDRDLGKDLNESIEKSLVAHYPFDKINLLASKKYLSKEARNRKKAAIIKEPNLKKGRKGNSIFLNEFTNITLPSKVGWLDHTDPFSISVSVFSDKVHDGVSIFTHSEDRRLGLKGYSLFLVDNRLKFIMAYSWPQNAIELTTAESIEINKWTDISITYDGSSRAAGVKIYMNGILAETEVLGGSVYKSILFEPNIHTYGFAGLQLGVRGGIKTFIGGGLDELKLFNKELSPLEVGYIFNKDISKKNQNVAEHYAMQKMIQIPLFRETKKWRDSLTRVFDGIPEIMVLGDLPEPRRTFVLDRGVYDAPTDEVQPSALNAVLEYEDSLPKNRLGLTQWLFDDRNPLTARVFVNRIWAMHFGTGLVKTADDFGNQGDLPINKGVLDYLAVYFMENDWDIKKLHKEILMSATFRQSSVHRPELDELDPENKLLARGPAFRLSAEMIRDNALAISGLLVNKKGGKSVYPYQPEGLWDEISNKVWRYPYLQKPGVGLYRRSLYTIWKRTSAPPSMLIFDVPDRSFCTVARRNTSTPLQALVLLNDPQYIEAARVTAENILRQSKERSTALRLAFRQTLGRYPDKEEEQLLKQFYAEQYKNYSLRRQDALAYLSTGEIPRDESLEPAEIVAMTLLINGMMNTVEAYSRN